MSDGQFYSFYQHQFGNDRRIAFNHLEYEKFTQALSWAISKADAELEAIVSNKQAPSFVNTIIALEQFGQEVDTISSLFFNLYHAESLPVLQQQVEAISMMLSKHKNAILLNETLFARIKTVYQTEKQNKQLQPVDNRLLCETYTSFANNGALLDQADKKKLQSINEQLSQLGPKFSKNVLDNTNAYAYHTDVIAELDGIPEHVKQAAKRAAKRHGQTGWRLQLHAPCYLPVMQYANNRDLRERLYKARAGVAFNDEYDNTKLIKEIVALRKRKALLLGFTDYADYILQKRMAKNVVAVDNFLDELEAKYRLAALDEFAQLESLAQEQGVQELAAWDVAYFSMQQKLKQLQFDEEKLRSYFRHDRVLDGLFALAGKLYGLSFKQEQDIQTYHKDVLAYAIYESNGSYLGFLYVDLYPREGKNQGAWMTTWKTQHISAGVDQRPIISIVTNATPKNDAGFAFFSYDEVETLFHEFGHALHAACSKVQYASLASPNVYWDFVELPSQIMENFLAEKSVLDLFAIENDTGEHISAEDLTKIQKRESFQAGLQGLRQISLARLDLAWHTKDSSDVSVAAFEEDVMHAYRLVAPVPNTSISCQFSHIFAGGYAAGYYSYKWAEVLDADAFKYFKENGIFNPEIAISFRDTILALGNTIAPDELYVDFRKAQPSTKALLERSGF